MPGQRSGLQPEPAQFHFQRYGLPRWGGPANNGSENTIYAFNDDFTWVKGNHTFKFGGMYQLSHYNGFGRQCVSGCAGFSFTETGRGGDTNFRHRRRQRLRFAPARLGRQRQPRHHPVHRPAVARTLPATCRTTGASIRS